MLVDLMFQNEYLKSHFQDLKDVYEMVLPYGQRKLTTIRKKYAEAADAESQELEAKLAEEFGKQVKERDEKNSKLDFKLNRLHKRAKQQIQEVQKEKDDLEAKYMEVNEKSEQAASRLANNRLRDNIEELRRSIKPKENAIQSLLEKEQVSTLQKQVMGEEKLKATFEEFKQYEDNRVEQRCTEMDARLDALSIDYDEIISTYAYSDRRIAKGMSEGLKHGVEHEKAKLDLEAIEAYDPEAEAKYIATLHALKNLKYPLLDQLESLKDAPMDVIMASLHLESDIGDDAPQCIRCSSRSRYLVGGCGYIDGNIIGRGLSPIN
nr:hypothetical protein [Tanacetum cinerariifolium]